MLKDITNISSGHLFRSKPDYVNKGGLPVIHVKDVSPGFGIDWESLSRVRLEKVKDDYLLREGDILARAKGEKHFAVYIGKVNKKALISSQFLIIRLKPEQRGKIIPEYLAWYLNQSYAQQYIERLSVGTYIKTLSISSIADMPVRLPSVDIQQTITKLCGLKKQERQLVERIQQLREKLINAVMMSAIEEV